MKRFLWILCCIMLMSCSMACNKDDMNSNEILVSGETTSEEDGFIYYSDIRYAERYSGVSISEAGILYEHMDRGIVHLITIDEGDDIPFCYDSNCRHPSAEETNGDPKCMGALYPTFCKTAYYNGTLYFFDGDGVFDHNVYAVNTNGSGRRLLAKLPFFYHLGYVCIFKEDKVYYLASMPYEDEELSTAVYQNRVVELSLKDGSYRFITEVTPESWINDANMAGDTIYIRKANYEDKLLFVESVNVKTLETRVVITPEEWQAGNRYINAYDDDSYYYWDRNKSELGIKNVDGTVEEVLLRGADGEEYHAVVSCDGMLYKREFDYENEPAGTYFLDMETGKTGNITEEAGRYNIVGYDGYYDVFIGREYVEVDGKGKMQWSLWSKDKVLGEARAGQQTEGNEDL